ncbi:hypothetical protein KVR01_012924 [Diaporthe batatas]|uniref:uncharacterized protein n=1 Tax=Diaporthe batatas TaxID=748121 RepID=UPI001D04F736|nr:uncharacterized protein KVR01_012924 [Diaporthe batatas]KAG8157216.1 hypothetical protein KVR01_012924 [Diaporthe batatas]
MAAVDVQILKDSGSIAVRYANGNLRIPGFRLLHCNTTVDMDRDPELYMMLEPVVVTRSLNKATPNTDSRNSSRRLRFVFKAVIMFFRWRLPSGEKILRDKGIDNLHDEVFEEIKAALVRSDSHFSKFSAMAIKRCLQVFTANVMDHARTLGPSAKGDHTARDLAREAWEAVKHFKAMLTKDWATIPEPNFFSASGPPASPPPASSPPAAGPPIAAGPSTPHPPAVQSQNQHESNSPTYAGELPSSPDATGAAGNTVVAPQNLTSATTTRSHSPDGRTALQPMPQARGGPKPSRQQKISDDPLNIPKATASPKTKTPEKRSMPNTKPCPTSVLGKHPRGRADINEARASRPALRQKKLEHDNIFDAARAGPEAREAWYDREHEKYVARKHEWEDKAWAMKATHKDLACEVLDLRRRVRILEKEKEEALATQRQQLRPGLVTMKMTPRVQKHANRLFSPTSSGPVEPKPPKALWSYHGRWAPWPSTRTPHHVGIETWLDHVQNEAEPGDDTTLPPPWEETPGQKPEDPTPAQAQEELGTGTVLPPVGYFRHPRFDWESEKSTCPENDNESEVPTESSWCSSIPA